MFPKETAEAGGVLAPSLDADRRDELVQSRCLRVLPRARERIDRNPKRGTSELDKLPWLKQPPLKTGATTKLININRCQVPGETFSTLFANSWSQTGDHQKIPV